MAYSAESLSASLPITTIRKARRLPLPGEVLLSVGDKVEPDTPAARISLKPGIPWVVPVARLLGIETGDLPDAMLRGVGDRIKIKEVCARAKKGLYGQKEWESPTDGVIEEISERSGRVVIREEFGKEEPPISFDVAFELGCRPREVRENMLVAIGKEVKRQQILAKKGEMSAFFTKAARAPISGVIADIDDRTGYVTIARPFKEVVVNAYLTGTVVEIIPDRGVIVEVPGVAVTGTFGVGQETHGVLRVLAETPGDPLTPDAITDDMKGAVLVAGSSIASDAFKRALEVGVRGIVAATANYLDLVESLGVKLGVGITGQEEIDLTVILMEGFGRQLEMRTDAFETFKALNGRVVSLNGATQVRAGAIRPEILAAFPEYEGDLADNGYVDEDLAPGQRVRIINDPNFGAFGTIVSLPREAHTIETEARVPVAEVKLDQGETVLVPRKNVEHF